MKKPGAKKSAKSVDTHWILSRLKECRLSQRELARRLALDPSAVFHLIRGNRALQMNEAVTLAKELQVSLPEILEHFGAAEAHLASLSSDGVATGSLEVAGWLDSHLLAHFGDEGLKGKRSVPSPFPTREKDMKVLRCQTSGSEFDGLDGALVYYKHHGHSTNPLELLGKAAIVTIADTPGPRLRVLRRGYSGGHRFHLASLGGRILEEDARVEFVSPVLWIKF